MTINLSELCIKRAFARVVLGWVTSWEVWFGGAKSGQYCVIGGESLHTHTHTHTHTLSLSLSLSLSLCVNLLSHRCGVLGFLVLLLYVY
jgi:hypothetical protein